MKTKAGGSDFKSIVVSQKVTQLFPCLWTTKQGDAVNPDRPSG